MSMFDGHLASHTYSACTLPQKSCGKGTSLTLIIVCVLPTMHGFEYKASPHCFRVHVPKFRQFAMEILSHLISSKRPQLLRKCQFTDQLGLSHLWIISGDPWAVPICWKVVSERLWSEEPKSEEKCRSLSTNTCHKITLHARLNTHTNFAGICAWTLVLWMPATLDVGGTLHSLP